MNKAEKELFDKLLIDLFLQEPRKEKRLRESNNQEKCTEDVKKQKMRREKDGK